MNLVGRMHTTVRGFQFQLADNRCDLNWLWLDVGLVRHGGPRREVRVRAINWELVALADAVEQLADGTRSQWQSKLLDSGLRLAAARHPQRGDAFVVTAMVSELGGPLPADLKIVWDGEVATAEGGALHGLRIVCSRAALRLFAADLRESLCEYPTRRLPKNRLHLQQPH